MVNNADGTLDARDAVFGELRIWRDADSDGITDEGELSSLEQLGIASLDLNATRGTELDNGNLLGLLSTYTRTDGSQGQMADVWFAKDGTPPAVPALGDLLAAPSAEVLPPTQAATPAATGPAAATTPTPERTTLGSVERSLAKDDDLKNNSNPLI